MTNVPSKGMIAKLKNTKDCQMLEVCLDTGEYLLRHNPTSRYFRIGTKDGGFVQEIEIKGLEAHPIGSERKFFVNSELICYDMHIHCPLGSRE